MARHTFPQIIMLGLLALGMGLASAQTQNITPKRVGPVSQYGQLQAGKDNAQNGRIYGSCRHFRSSGHEVQVKGMSLFWSCAAKQQRYWKKDIITGLVERQNIQLIRAAMAVDDMGEWADGHYFTKPDFYQAMLDEAVEAAIENDIYVIIDFHSHVAADSVENAKSFFRIQAEKWGKYDNVIFEVFNEPICTSGSVGDNSDCSEYGGFIGMNGIKTYADQVVSVIREYSDNLIIVGTPMWDQYPNAVVDYPVEDPLERDNIAYAFHFYAGRDDGTKAHDFSLTSHANFAMQKGLSVFVSEWGTVGYDGGGVPSTTLNPQWQTWMNSRKISSANWNVGKSDDPSSESGSEYFGFNFDPDSVPDNWTYSRSGQWVNANVFNDLPATYTACDDYVPVSSSSSGGISSSSGGSGIYTLMPVYDYAYAGGGWTVANPEGEWGTEATVYDQELGDYFWGLKNVSTGTEDGYAGVSMNVFDLSGCRTLSYKYIGIAHNLTFANTPDGADVTAEWSISGSDTWTTHTFNMASLSGIDLDNALDIKWQVSGGENGNLYIKDIQCIKDGYYSSSSSGKENSSSSVKLPEPNAPTTNTELVDDFEDGNLDPLWDVGPYWVETDVIGGGGASTAELSIVKGNNSSHALQMTYSLDVGEYPWGPPYATISTNDFMDLNLSQCSEVRYDYKGAAHSFRVKVSETMNNLLDMGWGFPTFVVSDSSASWQTVTIPIASLRQQWTGGSGNWVDIETVLPYVNGFDWRIDGKDVDDVSSGTLAIDNIRCIGLAETQYYTITFKNGDEDYEVKDWAAGSNVPDPAGVPAKAADAQYTYVFDYWTWYENEWGYPTRLVVGEATYEAVYTEITNAYTVTFLMDDDATPVENGVVENVDYGTPVADIVPAAPTKDADAQFTYTFGGWNPAFTDETIVTGDVSYKATFTTVTNKYSVAFVDDDETSLKTAVEYDYGTPVDQIDVPVVADKGGLKFAGWEPGLAVVTKNVIYKALYTDKIVITWKDDDGSVLRLDYVDDGDMPYYGEDPAKDTTAEYTYTFDKWTPAVVAATENATYTASYTSVKNKYDVTFVAEHNPDANITVSKEYGEAVASFAPQVDGAVTAEYTYVFDGWMPVITDQTVVTGGVTYTAKYKQNKNQYTVAFVSDDGSTPLSSVTRDYGTEIASMFPSPDPAKDPTVAKTYEFDRWVIKVSDTEDAELAEGAVLVSDMKLKAVFKEFDRRYAVTFVNYDNSPLKSATLYVYNTPVSGIALPDDSILVRPEDDNYTYTFAGWEPELSAVTKEQVYTAKYTRTAKTVTYTITWMLDEGEPPLGTETYAEGEIPAFNGTPAKDTTAEYTYTFVGWTPEIVPVTGDATYTAVFKSVKNSYTITFLDWDGSELAKGRYDYNTAASVIVPEDPTRENDAHYSYTFAGWNPAVVAVTDSATYKATYTSKALPQPESSSSSKKVEPAETSSSKAVSSSSKKTVASSSSGKAASSSSKAVSSSSKKSVASSSSKKSGKSSSSSKGKSDMLPTMALKNMSVLFTGNALIVTAPQSSWVGVQVFDMLGNDRGSFRASVQGSHVFSLQYLEQGRYLVRVSNGSSVQKLNILVK
ncbi:MAG: cellulase family glycosylhydrolase [Fibrobacter sp.]|nr:cellulase family glycosylhydrolase [Fibrobacter sp.]